MEFEGFDWDAGNRGKCQKHGVSVAEIEALFSGTLLVAPDVKHSGKEQRFHAIGKTGKRSLFIVFTLRRQQDGVLIRPISARYMHQKEIKAHEKEISKL